MTTPGKKFTLDLTEGRATGRSTLAPAEMLTFAAVAREGGVRAGALALGIPRSTVSRQLAQLEKQLEGRLVSRSTRKFALTDLGQRLAEQCGRLEEVLRSTDEILAHAAREPTGVLKVAASPVVGEEFLPEVLTEYLRRCPRVGIEVHLSVDFVNLRRGGFDLAVRTGPLEDASELFATRLGTSLKGLYASEAYLAKNGTPQTPADLAAHDCITVDAGKSLAWGFPNPRGGQTHVAVQGRVKVDSYRLARSAAVAGLGIARIPSTFAHATTGLVPLLERYWPKADLFAVHGAGHPAPPKIRIFIEVLRAALKRQLPG
jgi:DNA-binding transcriptional LysR family regulator